MFLIRSVSFITFFRFFILFLTVETIDAATIESTATGGDWNNGATWLGGVVPLPTDDVVIATTGGNSVTLSGPVSCASLTINLDGILNAGTHLITLSGNFIIIGAFNSSTGGLTLTGTGTQLISGFTTTGNISMTKTGGTATFVGNISAGQLTINGTGGTLNLGIGRTHTFTGNITLTNGTLEGGSSTLNVNATSATSWTGTGSNFVANTSTVVFGGDAQTINTTTTFHNLTYAGGGGKTIAGSVNVTVNGTFTIANGTNANTFTGTLTYGASAGLRYNVGTSNRTTTNAEWPSPFVATGGVTIDGTTPGTITLNAAKQMGNNTNVPLTLNPGATLATSNFALTLHGDFINNATLSAGSSNIILAGTVSTQQISGFNTTGQLQLTKTAGTATLTNSISVDDIVLNGSGGTLDLGSSTHSVLDDITLTAGTMLGNTSTLSVGDEFTATAGIFTGGAFNLLLPSGNGQGIVGFTTTGNINVTKTAGTATFSGNVSANNLSISGGTINLGTGRTHTFSGTLTRTAGNLNFGTNTLINLTGSGAVISGTIAAGTNTTVVLAGAAQTVANANTFEFLTLSGTGSKTFSGALTINDLLTIENGSNTNSFVSLNYGTTGGLRYNAGASTRTVGGEWPATLSGALGVTVGGTGIITLNADKTIGNGTIFPTLTIEAGATLATNNFALNLQGDFVNNGTFTAGSSNITLTSTAATQSISGFTTTGTLSMTKTAGVATLTGSVSAGGLTINGAGGTINMGASLSHTFSGTWTRTAGTLNLNSSTMSFTLGGIMFSGTGGTFVPGTGTVIFSGAAQTCPELTYQNLTLSGSGTKTFATSPTVNGVLSIEGTADVVVTTGTITYGGDATLRYNRTTPYTVTLEEFPSTFAGSGGVIIAGTGIITLGAAKVINFTLNINTGAMINLGTVVHSCQGLIRGGSAPLAGNFGGTGSGAVTIDPTFFDAATGQINSTSTTATWNAAGAVDTDWENNLNWIEGAKPTALTDAIIPAGATQPTLTANAVTKGLHIQTGATVTTAGFQLTIHGDYINDGTLTAGSSNIILAGAINQFVDDISTTGDFTSTKTGGIARFTGNLTANAIIVNGVGGTLNLGTSHTHTLSGNINVINGTLSGGTSIINVSGDITNSGTISGDTCDLIFTGTANQSIAAFTTLGNVSSTKTAGTATLAGNINAANLTVNGTGGTLNLGTNRTHTFTGNVTLTAGSLNGGTTTTLNVAGNWTGTGTLFTAGTSTVVLNGAAQSINTSTTFNNLTYAGTGGKTIAGAVTATVNGTMRISNGTNANTFTGSIAYGPTAALAYNPGANRTAGAEWPATFNATGGILIETNTITMNGAKILGTGVNLNITSTLSTNNNALTVEADITGGTLTAGSSNITFTGTANQNIRGFTTTGTVFMTKTGGTATFTSNVSTLNITLDGTGGTLNFGTGLTHSISGNLTITAGTLVGNSSNLTITGANTQSIAGFTTTGNISMTKTGGTATITADLSANNLTLNGAAGTLNLGTALSHTFTGTVTRTAGTLNLGSSNLILTNASPFTGTGATIVVSTSSITYAGAAQTVLDFAYHNLILEGSGIKTVSPTVIVNNQLTIGGTATLSTTLTYGPDAQLRYNKSSSFTTTNNEFPSPFTSTGGVVIGGTGLITLNSTKVIVAPLQIETGAQLDLSTFTDHTSEGLILGGVPQSAGTWGGNTSAASNINPTFFATATGIIDVINPNATWLGITSDWSTATNWSNGVVPSNTSNVTINSGTPFQPILTASSICRQLVVSIGATLNTASFDLTIHGDFTPTGTVTFGASNVILAGVANQEIGTISTTGNISMIKTAGTAVFSGNVNANSIILNGTGGTLSLGASLTHTITGNLTITAGTLDAASSSILLEGTANQSIAPFTTTGNVTSTKTAGTATLTGNANFNSLTLNGTGGSVNLGTSLTHTITGNITITAGTLNGGSSNIILSGTAAQSIAGFATTGNFTCTKSAGTATLSGNLSCNTISVNLAGGTLNLGTGSHTITGNIAVTAGTLIGSAASLTFTGTAAQSIAALTTTGNITSTKTGGTVTFGGNISANSLTVNGTGGTVNLGVAARTHTFSGDISVLAGTLNANAASLVFSGTSAQSIAGFTTSGNISMIKTGGGTATFTGNVTAVNLILNGFGGILNLGNGLTHTFSGTWTRTNGTLDGGTSTLNFTASGTFISGVSGSFIPNGGTVNYAASANQTVGAFTYNNLTLSGSGVKTTTSVTVNGVLSMQGTATVSDPITYGTSATLEYNRSSAYTTTVNEFPNTFSASGGVVVAGTGVITFNAAKAISSALTINTGASVDLNAITTHSCNGLILGGVLQSALGTYGRTGSGADNINDVFFAAATSGRILLNSTVTSWLGNNFDWTDGTNWTNGVPTSFSDVVINSAVPQQPIVTAPVETRNLTINSGATYTSVGAQLSLYGDLVNNGTISLGASPVVITGTATQTIDGFNTTGNLSVTKLGGVATLADNIEVNSIILSGAGGTLNLGAALTHTVTGNITVSAGSLNGGSSNVVLTGTSNQTIAGFTTTGDISSTKTGGTASFTSDFSTTNFTVNGIGGTVNFGTGLSHSINGNLIVTAGTLNAGSSTISLSGNLNNSGTFNAASSNLVLFGTSNQSIAGYTTSGNITMIKTSGTATLAGNITAGLLTLNGLGGTLNLGTGLTHTFNGDITFTQGTLVASNSTLNVASNSTTAWTGDGSLFNAGTGTVVFSGDAQTVNASSTFNNLTLMGGGAKTFEVGTTTIINGIFSIQNGTHTNVFTGATLVYGSSATLRYNVGSSSRTTSTEWPATFTSIGGIIIDGSSGGIITLNEAKVIGSNNNTHLVINSGATLATSNHAVTLHGNFVNNGTFNAGSSAITLEGTNATQTIDALTTTGIFSLTKTAGTATLNGNVNADALNINGSGGTLNMGSGLTHTFTGNVTLTTGTLAAVDNTININASGGSVWSGSGGVFSRGTSTVVFGGNAPGITASTDFHNLTFNGTGTAIAPASIGLTGNLITNQIVNFNTSSNTLLLDGVATQTISGTSNPVFHNVTVSNANDVQLNLSTTIANNTSLLNGNLIVGNNQLTLSGAISRTSGKLDVTTGTLLLNGSSAQSLPASVFLHDSILNLTINNSSGVTLNSSTRLTGNLQPTSGTFTTNGHLTLGSTALRTARVLTGSASGGYITGSVRIERYVPASLRNWRFMSSPATATTLADWQAEMHVTGPGGALNGFDATTNNRSSVFWYDEANLAPSASGNKDSGWVSANNIANSLVPGRGYRVFVRGDRSPGRLDGTITDQNEVTLNLNGTLNQGNINIPVSCTFSGAGSTYSDVNDGWNLVGNPYACDYDWQHFWDNNNAIPSHFLNLESDIWIFDPVNNNYVTYDAAGSTGTGQLASGIIPSGSAFWVKANNSGPVLKAVEASKTSSTPGNLFKNEKPDRAFRVLLNDLESPNSDELAILYDGRAARTFDKMDAAKLSGAANIAALTDDGKLTTINSRPAILYGDTIPLAIKAEKGTYVISFKNFENLYTDFDVVLVDYYTRTVIDARAITNYQFVVTESLFDKYEHNRFKLIIGPKDKLPEPGNYSINLANAIKVFPNPANDVIYVNQIGGLEIQMVTVYDIAGKIISHIPYANQRTVTLHSAEWTPGVYLVETKDIKGNVVKQKVVKQ
jgi:hypothetical protein